MNKMFKSNVYTIRSFFEKNKFKLLESQREYKWTGEIIKEFLDDLFDSFYNEKNSLLGCVYTLKEDEKDDVMTIIDGQQRITSLLLIIKVILEIYLKSEKEKNKKFYENKFICNTKRSKYENDINEKIFRTDNLSELLKDKDLSKKELKCKNLNVINNWLEKKFNYDKTVINNFFNFILDSNIILINFSDSTIAFETFIKLNARGVELTELELLHSYISSIPNDRLSQKKKEDFSLKFFEILDKFKEVNSYKKNNELFDDAFKAAYRIYSIERNIDYKPKKMFSKLSQWIQQDNNIDNKIEIIIEDFLFFCEWYYELLISDDIISELYKNLSNQQLINRKEYIPILVILKINSDGNEVNIKLFVELLTIISYFSYFELKIKSFNDKSDNKFNSSILKFEKVYKFIDRNMNESNLNREDIKCFILEHFNDMITPSNIEQINKCPLELKKKAKINESYNLLLTLLNEYNF